MGYISKDSGNPAALPRLVVLGHELPLVAAGPGTGLVLALTTIAAVLILSLLAATALALAVYAVCAIELLRLAPRPRRALLP